MNKEVFEALKEMSGCANFGNTSTGGCCEECYFYERRIWETCFKITADKVLKEKRKIDRECKL